MEINTKIVLGIVGGVLLCCMGLGVVAYQGARYAGEAISQSTTDDPDEVNTIAAKIAGFELPPGYGGRFGMSLIGTHMVGFGGASAAGGQPMLLLLEYPAGLGDPEQLKRQLAAGAGQGHGVFTPVETRELSIRGAPATVTRSRGETDDGEQLYQEVALFVTSDGLGMVMAMGPVETWNQRLVDQFITSLR